MFALYRGFLDELRLRALQHVDGQFGHWPETAALDQDRLFVKNLRRLHHFAVGGEHGRVGQAVLHQFQAHDAVVHVFKGRSGEFDHVHLHPLGRQIIHQ